MKNNKLEWHTEKRTINSLIPFEQNPRKMSEDQVKQLTTSLEKFGLVEIPAIDTDNVIIAGHQRMKVMQILGRGEEEIDVRVPNRKLTDKEYKEYNVRSNKNTGSWDDDLLGALFDEQELRDIGFTDIELGMLSFEDTSEAEDDVVPELPEDPQTKLGDLYEFPDGHRILCGDSTKKEDTDKLMNGLQADMIFTDPPYNVDYSGRGENTSEKILNDKMSKSEFDTFLNEVFKRYSEISKPDAGWYVFHSSSTQHQFQKAIEEAGWSVKCQIIWNKPTASMGWGDYRYKHEPMFYCGKENTNFYGDRTGTTIWDFHKEIDDIVKWAKTIQDADKSGKTTIWTMKREPVGDYVHPCLPAGERVFVSGKWKSIEKVKKGEKSNYGKIDAITTHIAKNLIEIESGEIKIRATSNHPFLVLRRNKVFWIEAGQIKKGDNILANSNVYDTLKPLWDKKELNQNTLLAMGTQQKRDIIEYMMLNKKGIDTHTILSGKKNLEKFQKESKFIIKMKKNKTIELKTLNLLTPLLTKGITPIAELQMVNGKRGVKYVYNTKKLTQLTGITHVDGLQEDIVNNAGSNKVQKLEKFLLRKVGSVKIIQKKTKVYNLSINGVPAFDTVLGVSHNTQKPVELIEYALRNSSKNGQLVADLFLGSGATLIACGKKGRICYGMELDPKYVDCAIKRLCDYTGNNKVIKNGIEIEWNG